MVGALVRAHGAGLSCPDWPFCFGQWVPAFDLRIAFEYGHRVLAGSVSLVLAALSASLFLFRRPLLRRLRVPLALAWGLLAVQIVLGGLTVLLKLAPWTVTAHLLTGTSFCAALLWIARDAFEAQRSLAREPLPRALRAVMFATAAVLVAQIALGGMVSSHAAGLACPDFPTCDGTSLAPAFGGLVGLAVLHRANAMLLLVCFAVLVAFARQRVRVVALAWAGLRLVVVQIAVGALNVLTLLPVEITALHSALAAAIALTVLLLVREAVLAGAAVREPAAGRPVPAPR